MREFKILKKHDFEKRMHSYVSNDGFNRNSSKKARTSFRSNKARRSKFFSLFCSCCSVVLLFCLCLNFFILHLVKHKIKTSKV